MDLCTCYFWALPPSEEPNQLRPLYSAAKKFLPVLPSNETFSPLTRYEISTTSPTTVGMGLVTALEGLRIAPLSLPLLEVARPLSIKVYYRKAGEARRGFQSGCYRTPYCFLEVGTIVTPRCIFHLERKPLLPSSHCFHRPSSILNGTHRFRVTKSVLN